VWEGDEKACFSPARVLRRGRIALALDTLWTGGRDLCESLMGLCWAPEGPQEERVVGVRGAVRRPGPGGKLPGGRARYREFNELVSILRVPILSRV
jgi:hypothetical protein